MPAKSSSAFVRVPSASLYKSQPNPRMFGNPAGNVGKGWDESNWLTSRFHFSFAEHFGGKSNFGVLRVLNDDRVMPKRGFGAHPHRDMEIVTYIVEGELTHQDSMGTAETLGRGAVQFMTAGHGVVHSEHNLHAEKPLRFIQMWITPRQRSLEPNYGSEALRPEARRNAWAHLVTDVRSTPGTAPVAINQDANIFAAEVDAHGKLSFEVKPGRQAYIVDLEGAVAVRHSATSSGEQKLDTLERHDAAEITGPQALEFTAGDAGTHLLLIEMAASA